MKDKKYNTNEFFISFEDYQKVAGIDKTRTDYIISYLVAHPHAKQYLDQMSENKDGSRVLDKLPSSFWASSVANEYDNIYAAARSDFTKNGLDIQSLSLQDYTEHREYFDELEMTSLADHVQMKINESSIYFFEQEEVKPAIVAALSSYNISDTWLKDTLKTALYISYSQCISDYATESATNNNPDIVKLQDVMSNFAVAIMTPISNILKNKQGILAKRDINLEALESLNKKLNLELQAINDTIKNYEEKVYNCEEIYDQQALLTQMINKNTFLIMHNIILPSDYVERERQITADYYMHKLKAYNDVLHQNIKLITDEMTDLLPKKDWQIVTDPALEPQKKAKLAVLATVKETLEEEQKLIQALVDGNNYVPPDFIPAKKLQMVDTLQNNLLKNPLIKENQPFFIRIFNSLIERLFHLHIKSRVEKAAEALIEDLNGLSVSPSH